MAAKAYNNPHGSLSAIGGSGVAPYPNLMNNAVQPNNPYAGEQPPPRFNDLIKSFAKAYCMARSDVLGSVPASYMDEIWKFSKNDVVPELRTVAQMLPTVEAMENFIEHMFDSVISFHQEIYNTKSGQNRFTLGPSPEILHFFFNCCPQEVQRHYRRDASLDVVSEVLARVFSVLGADEVFYKRASLDRDKNNWGKLYNHTHDVLITLLEGLDKYGNVPVNLIDREDFHYGVY